MDGPKSQHKIYAESAITPKFMISAFLIGLGADSIHASEPAHLAKTSIDPAVKPLALPSVEITALLGSDRKQN